MLPKFSQIVNRLYAFIYETNHSKSGLGLPSIVALVMVIDKSWTLLERHEKAFYTGITKFVNDCNPLVNCAGNIKCPCKSCRTVLRVSIENLPKHITRSGRDPGYKTWVHHGEPNLPPPPPVIDNTRQPQMSDMIALLNDLSYIPPNNEQNEPTQGDIGKTSNELTQDKRNEFEELYTSANEELYPGCDYVTRLDFMNKVVDILCNLELIYPPAFFDIMIHLVIHLPLEALKGGPIRPQWMFPFERFMKKLKGYVRNKAKPEGSIAEGYVAKEALTFSSHYFRDVTMKFNHPDRNADPPPPTCQFQVFRSVCKSISLWSVIRFDVPRVEENVMIRQRHVDNDPGVSATSELFALACGPTPTPISVNSCVVNCVTFVVHSSDERRTTQNNSICSLDGKDGEMYHGQLQEILEFSYFSFKVVLFRVKWFDTSNKGRKVKHLVLRNNMTQILTKEEYPDVIHFDNSSDLPLSTSLNGLDNATLHIDGQSTKVDAPSDIIDLDEDDDIIDDEDALPLDLADSEYEDLVNVDNDDDGVDMSADVARGHGGKGTRKSNLGGRKAGRLHTLQETRNLGLKKITDDKGPVPIQFEWDDKKTMMALGDHASHWSNYLGDLIREMPLYCPSWRQVPAERKVAIMTKIGVRKRCPENITSADWDAQIAFWNDPKNQARAAQNRQNRAKSTMESSATREYPSQIHTFFVTHTVGGVFTRDEDRAIYGLRSNTLSGVPYTEEEINALARKGKQRGHLLGVGRVLLGRATDVLSLPPPQCKHNSVDYESSPEFGNASGSSGCGDDEMAGDEDDGEDEEDEEDDDR
uniref:DUF4218 domain-containing protein n=1 Tax=Tanacetum cinerariifolium TaxID=118510 RepID=A0A6L2K0E6_TANCI|nr:hypothetical protein [Tanacetum cinerariifolium]